MHSMYNYIPETDHVSSAYIVGSCSVATVHATYTAVNAVCVYV